MPPSSLEIDIQGHLQRSFQCEIDENGCDLIGYRIVSDGAATYYYDCLWLKLGTTAIPSDWRDSLRYAFRKHAIIANTLVFGDSLNDPPESFDTLMARVRDLPDFESFPESHPFFSIEFKIADHHEIKIVVTYENPTDNGAFE